MHDFPPDLVDTGRLWLRGALSEADLAPYDALADISHRPGARLALDAAFAANGPLARCVATVLPAHHAVRAVAFNKTAAGNWGVPWHQDRVIPVAARHDVHGFHNWSQKGGVWHCEPPFYILSNMFFARVHLDATDVDSGPMEIALGSHGADSVSGDNAERIASRYEHEFCLAERGDVLILHMLILHRSRPATRAASRRTLRVDYAAHSLPAPLAWAGS
jgi:ectoine hydroxylase-related dioxygenase (phytanoyl-CoA dioxygenase family)